MALFLDTRYAAFRQLCWSLAILMLVSPSLPLLAQEVAQQPVREVRPNTTLVADPAVAPSHLNYILPQSCLVVSVRPQQVLTSKQFELYPIEVVQAASLQHTGLDPLTATHVVASIEPPMAGPPNYSVMATFTKAIGGLHPKLTAHTQPSELEGQEYLQSRDPFMPSIYAKEGKTLLAAPDMTIQKFVRGGGTPEPGVLVKHLAASASDDVYIGIDLQPLRPLINQILMQKQSEIPPEFQFVNSLPDLVRLIELRLNLTGKGPTELTVDANNERDAAKILALLDQAAQSWIDRALEEAQKLKLKEDPVEQAMGRYIERITGSARTQFMPKQEGARLVLFRIDESSDATGMASVATIGILVALLLPAVQAAREAARRASSLNNMKQIMLGILNYESTYKRLPPYANLDENGKPLLSWRVHILPFLEENALYDQFHLDEPWDSPHNKQLISKIPQVYIEPSSPADAAGGKTNYLGASGKGTVFDHDVGKMSFAQIRDGTSNTIAVLQVNDDRAAIWTKPEDWEYDENRPLAGLKPNLHPGVFLVAFVDGSCHNISQEIDPAMLKKLLTRAGGEVVDNREY